MRPRRFERPRSDSTARSPRYPIQVPRHRTKRVSLPRSPRSTCASATPSWPSSTRGKVLCRRTCSYAARDQHRRHRRRDRSRTDHETRSPRTRRPQFRKGANLRPASEAARSRPKSWRLVPTTSRRLRRGRPRCHVRSRRVRGSRRLAPRGSTRKPRHLLVTSSLQHRRRQRRPIIRPPLEPLEACWRRSLPRDGPRTHLPPRTSAFDRPPPMRPRKNRAQAASRAPWCSDSWPRRSCSAP